MASGAGWKVAVTADTTAFAKLAAEHVAQLAHDAIAERNRFTIALAGGETPTPVYHMLASRQFSSRINWRRVEVYWGDERCVPPDHPESNFGSARTVLLDRVGVPSSNVHRIRGELVPSRAASEYERKLKKLFDVEPLEGEPTRGFDLALLGMGEDGHTASLFPGRPAIHESRRWVLADRVEAPIAQRITLTPIALNASANIIVLVTGEAKAATLRRVLEGPRRAHVFPIQAIRPPTQRLLWITDSAAASRLTSY